MRRYAFAVTPHGPAAGLCRTLSRPARGKYGNIKTDGYASKKEALRAKDLHLLEESGHIKGLREQVRYCVIPKQDGERACVYVADFVYWAEEDGEERLIVEDVKSSATRTRDYIIKRKLMLQVYGIRLREI